MSTKPLTPAMTKALCTLVKGQVDRPSFGESNVFEALCRRDFALRTRVHAGGGSGRPVYEITAEGYEAARLIMQRFGLGVEDATPEAVQKIIDSGVTDVGVLP